ncbi:MAG: histidinol-phosphate transaminase [Candidatus Bathyarchaeota archaeon]|nr:histidinol-phosphate transaminase [Candidatus Bathyarchaeota archaeon]
MSCRLVDVENWVRDEVKTLEKVEHGGEVWKYMGSKAILDFSSNANPLGASPKVFRVLRKSLHLIKFLPDNDSTIVREAAARYIGNPIRHSNIIVGNGSTELIHLFALTFVKKGEECLIPIPTFGEYEAAVKKAEGKLCFLKMKISDNFTLNFDEILENIKPGKTKVVFICNPNNPTGQAASRRGLTRLLNETLNMGVMVFLDESYIEFSDVGTLANEVENYPNLFVLRSLTKAFGLMGLRIGYGVASEKLINFMLKVKVAWNVNLLAQIAAVVALKDKEHLEKAKKIVRKERQFLFKGLQKVKGFHVVPTKANFFLVDVKGSGFNAPHIKKQMLRHGILVRDCSSIKGLNSNYIRISVKRHQENRTLLKSLTMIVGG